jgi:hypothetical protein
LTEACGWHSAPQYLIRDRDGAYGAAFIRFPMVKIKKVWTHALTPTKCLTTSAR